MNREIFHIAIPAIVTNVTIPLLGLLDTAIAGHLPGGSGATFISAVAVGAMMFNLIYWNFGFLRMGTSGLTAQAYGSGDKAETVAVLQHAMALGFLISVGIIVLSGLCNGSRCWLSVRATRCGSWHSPISTLVCGVLHPRW